MRYREIIVEKTLRMDIDGHPVLVIKNPNITDVSGNLYVWDSSEATHGDVEDYLGVPITHSFMMSGRGSMSGDIKAHPYYDRFYSLVSLWILGSHRAVPDDPDEFAHVTREIITFFVDGL